MGAYKADVDITWVHLSNITVTIDRNPLTKSVLTLYWTPEPNPF